MDVPADRHHRQTLLPGVGEAGQKRLAESHVAVVGLGALGGTIAEQLARAGVGTLTLIDRDLVEPTNLQRQVLFGEADVGEPKADAAAARLSAIDSRLDLRPTATDLHAGNVEAVLAEADLICDGTDNAETRYLLNDVAVKGGVPMVYGGCVGTQGRALSVLPGVGPCLRCVFRQPPGSGELPTCDTAGVLGPVAAVTAAWQAGMALQILLGNGASTLFRFDLWQGTASATDASGLRRDDCPCCGQRRFEFLDRPTADTVSLCGRETMQVRPLAGAMAGAVDLDQLARRWSALGEVHRTRRLLRLDFDGKRVALFPDGRMLVTPARDTAEARSLYARLVGG